MSVFVLKVIGLSTFEIIMMNITEFNDLRKKICLRNLKFLFKEFQFGIHCLPNSYTKDVIDMLP